ncbi:hypothetical protein M758_5G045500 [Ceratodon purpureus]|nr:hypothetical protein M758_5G045500 [Ceratodon purpureus]
MITETPIAFGLTMVVCLSLFFYCWYIRKLRYRLTAVQVSATPNEVQEQTGIKREVVATFPTVKTHELKVDIRDELQCPICLVEYANTEILRKLPFCGHVFHIHCVDSWLQKHVTCPVCRIVLTEYHPKPEPIHQTPQTPQTPQTLETLQTSYCRGSSTPSSVTIEISPATPSWILVNHPLPLPPSSSPNPTKPPSHQTLATPNSTESGDSDTDLELSRTTMASPLQNAPNAAGWGAVYLQRSARSAAFSFRSRAADMAIIESKGCVSHASVSERWMTESFSFGDATHEDRSSSVGCFDSLDGVAGALREVGRRRTWRSRVVTESWDFGRMEEDEVVEECVGGLTPLTASPEHCSFEFLPVVTGPGGDYSLVDFHR